LKENNPSIKQFKNEHGKLVTLVKLGKIVIKTEMSEIVPGKFPIAEWRSFLLEVPSTGFKKYILGRFPGAHSINQVEEDSEVITLPVYTGEDICDARIFENFSNDPEKMRETAKIPVMTAATKTCGQYSDCRLIQSLAVIPVWNDGTSMVLELEWSEGNPEEDAINPEWYIQASPKLSVKKAVQKLKECSKQSPIAEKCSHYLYVNPFSLGTHVLGEGQEYSSKIWRREWKFDNCEKMLDAVDRLALKVAQLFE